jgi:hypothetical protein
MGLAALDAVMRRARAASLLLSLFIAEGTRVGREETCARACMSAARQWATYMPLHRGPATGLQTVGRPGRATVTERAAAAHGHVCVCVYMPCGVSTWRSCTRGRVKKGEYLYLFIPCPHGARAPEGV